MESIKQSIKIYANYKINHWRCYLLVIVVSVPRKNLNRYFIKLSLVERRFDGNVKTQHLALDGREMWREERH